MKEKQYQPAHNNQHAPEPGMASVNTHQPEEPAVTRDHTKGGEYLPSGEQEKEARDQDEEGTTS